MLVFSTERYAYLADALCAKPGFAPGTIDRRTFADGERYRRIVTSASGEDAVLVGGTVDEADTLEIYDLACALVHRGIHTLTLVIPWYGYQTMERAVKRGEVVVAKTRARLLSSIPIAGSGNRVVMIDLHAEGIPHYFSGSIRPIHVYAKPITLRLIRDLGGDAFVLGATDAGRAKWVESLANDLGVDAGFVFKRRDELNQTSVTALAGNVTGKNVVIYDDMIRTGGSLIGAARAYLEAGARSCAAVCTHGVFPGDAVERIQASGLFTKIACTDTYPRARDIAAARDDNFLRVDTVADLIAEFLKPGSHGRLP